ncbi:Uncharacterised protein [Orientia tsutsugamushi]|uniref:Uncharacterized protein n=1 Tax=Orientia tsutsugamushi TaxID=784 RepID=A0A2U3RPZ7_ORITS|nr:hypothetical protein OTSKARP_0550 [Orientia tsutsugamushi str. Karp]SPR15301.1 Uncharacterised protein [Orientia tsutsugamushi]
MISDVFTVIGWIVMPPIFRRFTGNDCKISNDNDSSDNVKVFYYFIGKFFSRRMEMTN